MKPHPRIRKTVKWGGAAVTVGLLIVWVASAWWRFGWSWRSTSFVQLQVIRGTVRVGQSPLAHNAAEGGFAARAPDRWRFAWWWPLDLVKRTTGDPHRSWCVFAVWSDSQIPHLSVIVILWPLVVAAAIPTALAWRFDALARRRTRLNLCPNCNYDRTGLAAGAVCPECGPPHSRPISLPHNHLQNQSKPAQPP